MLTKKDLQDRVTALEQFVEAKKNDYLKAIGRLEEQQELLGLMDVQEKKLLADAIAAEQRAKEEESAKGLPEESAAEPKKRKRKAAAPVEGVECVQDIQVHQDAVDEAADGMAVQD